ncbi:mCG129513 [Mus musculus]|nr:mCG129513 [Mus musculus]
MLLYDLEPDLSSDIKEEFAKLYEEHGIVRENSIDRSNAMLSGDFSPGLQHHPSYPYRIL